MQGTPSQIEWAEIIKPRVDAEFTRVALAFRAAAANQAGSARADTLTILEILEDNRRQVLSNPSAGYFISTWGELHDQVRRHIAADPRFIAIKATRAAHNALR